MTTLGSPLEEHAARYREHAELLLDEALRETFPASDPISVFVDASAATLTSTANRGARTGSDLGVRLDHNQRS